MDEKLKKLINDLKGPDEAIRAKASENLGEMAAQGIDISPIVPALIEVLLAPVDVAGMGWRIRQGVARALKLAAEKGIDLSSGVQAIENALPHHVEENAICALSRHYMNKKEWGEVEALLNNKDTEFVGRSVGGALRDAAADGIDIGPAVPALEKALEHPDLLPAAISAIVRHLINKKEWKKIEPYWSSHTDLVVVVLREAVKKEDISAFLPKLVKALAHENWSVRQDAVRTLEIFGERNPKSVLDEIEKSGIDKNTPEVLELINKMQMNK